MLARQQEIENLRRDLKASQLIADQALAGVARAEGARQQVSQSMGPARQRAAELTRRLHDVVLEYSRVKQQRSEEHTSELQSLMRVSYAVFCLKNNNESTPRMRY